MPPSKPDPNDLHSNNEVHRLDDMNNRLYERDLAHRKIRRFDVLHPHKYQVKRDWDEVKEKQSVVTEKIKKIASHPSFFKRFFKWSLVFAGLAVVFAAVMFFSGDNTVSNNNISINVLGNSFAAGGEQIPLSVEVTNKNPTDLQLADLFVDYDEGGDATSGASHVHELDSLGTIAAGKSATKNIFVTLYGEQASVKNIDFTLQYRIAGSNAIFVKTSTFPVTISSAPLSLSVDAPATLSPNQNLSYTVKVKSNSNDTVSGILLHIDYPSGFKFSSATPAPTSLNNVWDLGDIAPGAERDITVNGVVYAQNGEDQAFHVYVGAKSDSDATQIGVTYNSLLQVVSIVKPFISAVLAINGSQGDSIPIASNSTAQASIQWANNLPTEITDAQITVTISGNAIDPSSVTSEKGFYNSANQTIVYDQTTAPELAVIQPSDSGELDFSFHVAPLWTAGQSILTQPTVNFAISITGKQSDAGGAVTSVTNSAQTSAIVSSDLGFSGDAFYTSGPFTNTGPIPPQANQPTTYTVTWTVTNSANSLSGGIASAQLPTYVDWVGTTSPQSEQVSYDDTTRTVTWAIGQITPGTGLSGAARTASFQVRLTPSTSQIGSTPKLILDTAVSATDTFTGQTLTAGRGPISIFLQNDAGFPSDGGVVSQ